MDVTIGAGTGRTGRTACRARRLAGVIAAILVAATAVGRAEDWPEFRGRGRAAVWTETGILERFPEGGLKPRWRTPIKSGFSGPSVAAGQVFVMDFTQEKGPRGTERALALDEQTGTILWTREWKVDYRSMYLPIGPRATPTVDDDRVYFQGADGKLFCLRAKTGDLVWQKDFLAEYGAEPNVWGFSSSPLVDGNRLIALVGGRPDARLVAFDKLTGAEIWRALPTDSETGVATPIIIQAGGVRQLIIWYDGAVASLDPVTGKVYWQEPYKVGSGMSVATPVHSGSLLFFTNFYHGPLMLRLDEHKPAATVVWRGSSDSEIQTDGLHSMNGTPVIVGNHVYGVCSYGQLRCLLVKTGERLWESQALVKERVRWGSAFMVRHGDRLFVNNDRGELVIMAPDPAGYREIDRTFLIKPTTVTTNRRALGAVNWSEPAYANRHVYARNDEEIISVSLAADGR
jgi:outer membrane protein assembly factor BamB